MTAGGCTGGGPFDGHPRLSPPGGTTSAALIAAALILTLGIAPLITAGADHLDAPSLGSASVSATDVLSVNKVQGQLDINDVYVFDAAGGRTVLAMTVNPAVNLIGPRTFKAGAEYRLNVDRTGDAVSDQRYTVTFGDPDARGIQHYTVKLGEQPSPPASRTTPRASRRAGRACVRSPGSGRIRSSST